VESEEKSPEVNNLVSGLGPGSTCFAGSHRRSLGSGMQLLRGRETLGERLPARSTHRARPIRNTVPETVENDRLRSLFYIFRKRRTGGISANLKRCNMQNRHERDAHTPSSDTTCHRAPQGLSPISLARLSRMKSDSRDGCRPVTLKIGMSGRDRYFSTMSKTPRSFWLHQKRKS
jgi:hypothetical protein